MVQWRLDPLGDLAVDQGAQALDLQLGGLAQTAAELVHQAPPAERSAVQRRHPGAAHGLVELARRDPAAPAVAVVAERELAELLLGLGQSGAKPVERREDVGTPGSVDRRLAQPGDGRVQRRR